jgi:acetyl-CoA carboxylase biotin carboxyl carrier protein
VKSPIVGTFYRSSEPGAASFVEIGSTVKKGEVLCIIEAMKLMNEIDSEYDGEIVEHLRRERPARAVRRAAVRDQNQ